MPWIRRKLRDSVVYVKVRPDGEPAADRDGRVDIKYKLDDAAKVYRAAVRNLEPTGEPGDEAVVPDPPPGAGSAALPGDEAAGPPLVFYTDGACSGNPGPAGVGVVMLDGRERKELSEYLGVGTNNIAELVAIERALDLVPDGAGERPILVHVDSSYAIGVLSRGFKAKANVELIERIKAKARRFPRLRFVKVSGHAGVAENEAADGLARAAVARRR